MQKSQLFSRLAPFFALRVSLVSRALTITTGKCWCQVVNQLRACLVVAVALLSMQATSVMAAEVININQASAAMLAESLVGIGPVKAQAIVDYRNANGNFSALAELLSVPGIGESLFDKIKLDLSVSGDTSASSLSTAQETQAIQPVN